MLRLDTDEVDIGFEQMSSPIMSPSCGIPIMTEPPSSFFPEDERIDTYAPRL